MSYIAERRVEEKERRRAEIVDAAEKLYAAKGWDSVTMDQVAKSARLSRALLYVYFRDRDELQFAIGQRALAMLRERFLAAVARHPRGLDQVEAIGRAYMTYATDYPHYFDICARIQAHAMSADPGSNEGACAVAGDAAIGVVVEAIRTGMQDGSIRNDIGDPMLFAVTLWAFTHGVIQLMAKGSDLDRLGIAARDFSEYALSLLRSVGAPPPAR
ncbi:MAG TPA: TetR/AcrR family transcriptional regulator [Steroidobacteraceae bacterium]|nr:TetR/AcrR family transcriptional regulator [Steroidobacteraceae bacterium]